MDQAGNRTRLVAGMVFTLKATITVPDVGGLRTERIVTSPRRAPIPDAFPDAAPLVAAVPIARRASCSGYTGGWMQ